ncbi:MAG: hypothetical protein HN509_02905, partial [Halobacteriovoraceae bacterium]|nr:hypothetical protein [Halobacteriovoraceae bacterium]
SKDQEGAEQQSAIFKKFPRLALLMVRILRHPKALLGMLGILERPRIYFFGGCMLATMIMGWIWKRQMAKKNPGAARGFSNFFIRLSGMMGLRLVLFLAFFYKEAAPVLSILKKTFL